MRRARIERSLSIEETAWRTRMRPDLLRALEREDFDRIGHLSFVRTHLHSYARFLGIDASDVVEKFEEQQDEPLPSALDELHKQVKSSRKPPRPKWLVAAGISALVLIIAALAGLLGGQSERPATDAAQRAITSPLPGLQHGPVTPLDARVVLRVEVLASTQVSIIVDGKPAFEGNVSRGEDRTFRARDTIEVVIAKADAVKLTLNGTTLAPLGPPGRVARAKFGPHGRVN